MVNVVVFILLANTVIVSGGLIPPNIEEDGFQKKLNDFCKSLFS